MRLKSPILMRTEYPVKEGSIQLNLVKAPHSREVFNKVHLIIYVYSYWGSLTSKCGKSTVVYHCCYWFHWFHPCGVSNNFTLSAVVFTWSCGAAPSSVSLQVVQLFRLYWESWKSHPTKWDSGLLSSWGPGGNLNSDSHSMQEITLLDPTTSQIW